jgi:hypothetical protein
MSWPAYLDLHESGELQRRRGGAGRAGIVPPLPARLRFTASAKPPGFRRLECSRCAH